MSAAAIPVEQIKTITMSIYRYDPTVDKKPYMQDIVVEIPTDKDIMVLDALHLAKEQEPSLSYRRSCREGVCGSDGMNINGKNGLACVTPLSEVLKRGKITLRPMPGLPVIRDLIVDMKQFFDQLEKVKPYLITKSDSPEIERMQSPEDRDKFEDTTKCILCAACTTSCPVFWTADTYVGPAAIVNAHRFVFDSRDNASKQRLEVLKDVNGAFRCRTAFNCTTACPRGIQVTKAIEDVKRENLTIN